MRPRIADGNSPYRLAWGNHEVKVAPPTLKGLVSSAEWADAEIVGTLATEEAGGVSRLAAEPALPWKKWLLWALLIIGVFIAGRMAVTLYREMNQPESAKTSSEKPNE